MTVWVLVYYKYPMKVSNVVFLEVKILYFDMEVKTLHSDLTTTITFLVIQVGEANVHSFNSRSLFTG